MEATVPHDRVEAAAPWNSGIHKLFMQFQLSYENEYDDTHMLRSLKLKPFRSIFRTSLLLIGSGGFGLKFAVCRIRLCFFASIPL